LEGSNTVSGPQIEATGKAEVQPGNLQSIPDRVLYAVYALALAVSVSVWFVAIRAPLWLDETISFWQINAGFSGISSRQGLSFAAYSYILWFGTIIFGKSEIALRIPEILAMLVAVYLLYRAARELFDKDLAMIAAILFCVHPIVIFAAIDVRPYAFGALAINASILVLLHLRNNNSNWLAALFGVLGACTVYFHFLLIVILPALAICFIAIKIGDRKALWRQGGVALAAFALAFLPVIPGLRYMFHTSGDHVFADPPKLMELLLTLAPGWLVFIFAGGVLVAAATRKLDLPSPLEGWRIVLCAALGLVPILILYGVSAETSIRVFLPRYRLVAIPGIALCWAWLLSRIESRVLRSFVCVAVIASVAYAHFTFPAFKHHGDTWKYALEAVEKNASADNAPVLICSDLPEADYLPMPVGEAVKDSTFFAPLTYYKLGVPVVGLPRALTDEAIRIASTFLQDAAQRRERFLAVGFKPSYPTLKWIMDNASATHDVHAVGVFDQIVVLEFIPRAQADAGPWP
jgi:Dolichyl-phosphate-mannose-protein mannosyltransferase